MSNKKGNPDCPICHGRGKAMTEGFPKGFACKCTFDPAPEELAKAKEIKWPTEGQIEDAASEWLKQYYYIQEDFRKMIYGEWKAAIKWFQEYIQKQNK
jgi:hypothetical protein